MIHASGELPPISLVLGMTVNTAKALGVPIPGIKYLRHMMAKRIPVPQLFESDDYRLWADRYYIAFQPLTVDGAPVMYVYLSKAHITEELSADLKARQRGHEGFLDAPTRAQFAAAWRALAGSRMGYATRELKPTSRLQSPLDLKTPWCCGYPVNEVTAPASRRERR